MSYGGIFVSSDSGLGWTQIDPGWTARSIFDFAVIDNNILVATGGVVVYSYADDGKSWSDLT